MNSLVKVGVDKKMSFDIMESVRKGKWAKGKEKNQEKQEAALRESNIPDWFIESCRKIAYMFPRAHAAAYVVMALRIAYCKVHYPIHYYAAYFSVRATEFNAEAVLKGTEGILAAISEIEAKGRDMSQTEASMLTHLEIALEMYARGFAFLPVDLKKSRAKRFVIEGNNLRLPFSSIPKLGEKAAVNLERVMAEEEICSVTELKQKSKITKSVIETMREMGCLKGLPESEQMTLFDAL